MEIKYTRTYVPKGKNYTLGEMPVALGYAMEILSPRPLLKAGKLNMGEICMLLFALTPEEYALKDGDNKALDVLAAKLMKQQPADRLLAWLVRDLKGALVKSDAQPKLGESIDDGELAARVKAKNTQAAAGPIDPQLKESRRLQLLCAKKDAPEGVKADWRIARETLGRSLSELDSLFVAYDGLLNGKWPAVGFDGRVEIFTTLQRGENAARQVIRANGDVQIWSLREISGAEVEIFFRKLEKDGLTELRVDNGFASAELSLRDFRQSKAEENAGLRSMMLREIAYGVRWNAFKKAELPEKNTNGALESMLSLRNFVHHFMGKAVLYAACEHPADGGRLCTQAAKERMPAAEEMRVVAGEKCMTLMNRQSGQRMLAVFTDAVQAVAFCERMGAAARPVAMTFDDLCRRAEQQEGMVVDPDGLGYRVIRRDFDRVKEMRTKPLQMVRIKPEEAPVVPKPEVKPEMGSLPDPDEFPAADGDASEKQQPPEEDPPEDKGFFKRFFGK